MTIYERIRALRKEKKMSQQELADLVGYVGRSAISKVENGERDISQSMIVKYAEALGVTPTYLLYGDDGNEIDDGGITYPKRRINSTSPYEYVVFHRNGKNVMVKLNEEGQKIFEALVASSEIQDSDGEN